jgi:hypothetical protein
MAERSAIIPVNEYFNEPNFVSFHYSPIGLPPPTGAPAARLRPSPTYLAIAERRAE